MTPRIVFWVHDPEAPSFRHRLAAHIPALESAGFRCEVEIFPRRRYGIRIVQRLAALREFDLLVVAKLKLEVGERAAVRSRGKKIVYDFDDAVYFSKPDRLGEPPDRGGRRVRKFQAMCAMADLVTAGNETLASHARPHSRWLEIVPTAIDLSRYKAPLRNGTGARLVWIGLPGNLPYLDLLRKPLADLRPEYPNVSLRVVSERAPADFPVPVDFVRWSEEAEAADLAAADVGVMPLTDDDWTRGKGGFKLLQYMAARLPAVASPVGVNREIVADGETGILAGGESEWASALRKLFADPALAERMGEAGRRRVEERYERSIVSRRIVELYRSVAIPGRS